MGSSYNDSLMASGSKFPLITHFLRNFLALNLAGSGEIFNGDFIMNRPELQQTKSVLLFRWAPYGLRKLWMGQ